MLFDTQFLADLAGRLHDEAKDILDKFKDVAAPALQTGAGCLNVSGIDVESLLGTLNNLFGNLTSNIDGLADVLNNVAVQRTENTHKKINSIFNGDLSDRIANLVGKIGAGAGAAAGVVATGAIRPVSGCGGSRPISASAPTKVISACGGSRPVTVSAPTKVISGSVVYVSKPVQSCFGGYSATPVVSSAPRL